MSVKEIMAQLNIDNCDIEDVELIVKNKFDRHNRMKSSKYEPIETTRLAVQRILDYSPVFKQKPKFQNVSELVKDTANYYRRKDGTG